MVCLECRLGSQHIDDRCIGALSFSARSLALVLSLRVVQAFLSAKLGTLGVRHGGPCPSQREAWPIHIVSVVSFSARSSTE